MLYLSSNGIPYGGDRQQREDGSLHPILPERPDPRYQWDGSDWVLTLEPDWENLAAQFQSPGNALYASIYGCVKMAASPDVDDHWSNFKLLIVTPALQRSEALAAGINYLGYLLAQSNVAIPSTTKEQWNSLVISCQFPSTCQLN